MLIPRIGRSPLIWISLAAGLLALGLPAPGGAQAKGAKCPDGMANVLGRFCIDKYEASTVEVLAKGKTRKHSPFAPVDGLKVKAVSRKGV
ncbi:MAG: hypothetical protein L6Q76_30200, partial [Polyangiaceae bacterium]|nr:hypothetical protein [Polyangiaceae bacterium]